MIIFLFLAIWTIPKDEFFPKNPSLPWKEFWTMTDQGFY
jgi:hypothetical protein